MKKEKLSLDKLTVAKLSHTKNIFGGRKEYYDPTGIGVAPEPELYRPRGGGHENFTTMTGQGQSITPPEMRRSSKVCAG